METQQQRAVRIDATADEIAALVQLLNRAPMSTAERLFAENLLNRWYAAVNASTSPPAAAGEP